MSEIEIWTEKYRPKKLDNLFGQKEIVEKLKAFVNKKNIPHLLFAGSAGTGKTTCAMAVSRDLFGDEWHANFLEMNASDERGIDTIRTKVKDFARTRPIGNVPFKLILLDEADALTSEAQHALRRMMENYTSTCRFILDCNYSSKIILPIQSRCAIFRFKTLLEEDVKAYIENIAEKENLKLSKEAVAAIIDSGEGDLRKVTNILQSCAVLDKEVDESLIYSVAGLAKPKEMLAVIELALKGEMEKAKEKMFDIMLNYGLSGLDAVKLISKTVWDLKIENKKKIRLLDRIGEFEFRIVEGADEHLQIEALLAQFALVD